MFASEAENDTEYQIHEWSTNRLDLFHAFSDQTFKSEDKYKVLNAVLSIYWKGTKGKSSRHFLIFVHDTNINFYVRRRIHVFDLFEESVNVSFLICVSLCISRIYEETEYD